MIKHGVIQAQMKITSIIKITAEIRVNYPFEVLGIKLPAVDAPSSPGL